MRVASLFVGCLCYLGIVFADTEIINTQLPFPLPSPSSVLGHGQAEGSNVTPDLITIKPSQPIITNLTTSSPEKRFIIAFDGEDEGYAEWTIRVSWPGSSPTRITLNPPDPSGVFSITGSKLSPRMYHSLLSRLINQYVRSSPSSASLPKPPYRSVEESYTPISVILEPLLLGAIPKTTLPTVGVIVMLVTILALNISRILGVVENAINWGANFDGHEKED